MIDDTRQPDQATSAGDDLIEIDLNFESMRRFQAEFSQNLAADGLFIDTAEPLDPGAVVRFRVVLPEDFVFLEGTAVVEWVRRPEEAGGRPAGMALRFVTMSPQNQELVEQLVQDHIDAGGEPFDVDVRPVPSDFPTDALEGAPQPQSEKTDEAFRLTIRGAGPSLDEQALQALADAAPDGFDPPPPTPDGVVDETGDEPAAAAAGVGEPPELDLGADDGVAFDAAVTTDDHDRVEMADDETDDPEEVAAEEYEPASSSGITLAEPDDFDDGPEVIDRIDGDEFGGTTFDVSLPEADDEPDSTPVLPDEGGADVTVADDDEEYAASGGSRLWLVAALIAVVAVVAAVAFWPRIADRFARSSGNGAVPRVAEADAMAPADAATAPGSEVAAPDREREIEESGGEPAAGAQAGDAVPVEETGGDGDTIEQEGAGTVAESAPAVEAVAEPAADLPSTPAEPGPARSISDVAVEAASGRTVLRLVGDGSLEDGVISVEQLPSPPRILVRVRGIETGYRPYTIDSTTPEVSRVRIGHHADRRVPELWVVLDLTGTDVALAGVDIERDSARISVARP